jgi:hypothetical protein
MRLETHYNIRSKLNFLSYINDDGTLDKVVQLSGLDADLPHPNQTYASMEIAAREFERAQLAAEREQESLTLLDKGDKL